MSAQITQQPIYFVQAAFPSTRQVTVIPFDGDVYPGTVIVEPSFWVRFKKSIANMLTNTFCGITNRSHEELFGGAGKIECNMLPQSYPPI